MHTPPEILVIGGSAGSWPLLTELLAALPVPCPYAVVVVLHRLRNVSSDMTHVLEMGRPGLCILEPDDKAPLEPGCVYLAPQNYHLLVENDKTFSLDYSEFEHFSRPAIDATFQSVAEVFGPRAVAVLLSGANADGAGGLAWLAEAGARCVVQDPATAQYPIMPREALNRVPNCALLRPGDARTFLTSLLL